MRIAQINLGMIEIPPKSWGAIEKVIWNYKLELEKLGHEVEIVFPWELYENGKLKYDIVHFHVANQSIDTWNDSNLPYVFSIHDHHVVRYGKSSSLYFNNLIAMKKSVASITYAEMLVDYFDTTDKLFYIPHGVDTSIYRDYGIKHTEHRLLCVANNGYADDQSYDRKGFRFAIEAARDLDLPITIVGPDNNKNFFDVNKDLIEYEKISFIKNPNEKELVDIYNDHTIFLHPSELEAGHPNLTLLESLSCGVPIVGTFSGKDHLPGLLKCIRNSADVKNKILTIIDDYDKYKKMSLETAERYSWKEVVKKLHDFYGYVVSVQKNFTKEDMKNHVLDSYLNTEKLCLPYKEPKMTYNVNFNNGAFFQMNCQKEKNIRVDFIDKENDSSVFGLNMTSNRWAKPNLTYFKNWRIKVDGDDQKVFDFNLKGKNVLISFQSSSLGDSIAWVPYVEEFRKKHNCVTYCSTFKNDLFVNEYKNVIFINPGQHVENLYATYEIGWFSPPWGGKRDQHPNDYRLIPLQQTITDILGLKYEEIIPKITIPDKPKPFNFKEKYIVIAEHSTAQAKHWNYPNGWQILVDKLKDLGYKIVVISKQGTALNGIINETGDQPLEKRINQIRHSEFIITIGSGLAWVAWATGKKVVMISGFSKPFCEFKSNCIRIGGTEDSYKEYTCFGCFNDKRYDFDKGDWWWCPAHKDTPRAFECTKKITPDMVMEEIKNNGLI